MIGTREEKQISPVQTPTDEGDHDKFSHYVRTDGYMDALMNGTPMQALCGKMWVPTRDGEKFPVCPTCKEIWESMPD